jgi:hypothetical protein
MMVMAIQSRRRRSPWIACPYCGQRTTEKRAWDYQNRNAVNTLMREIVDIGFKALAKKLHPDTPGGSDVAFKRLVQTRDYLRARAR